MYFVSGVTPLTPVFYLSERVQIGLLLQYPRVQYAATKWTKWLHLFELFLTTRSVEHSDQKRVLLLNFARQQLLGLVVDIFAAESFTAITKECVCAILAKIFNFYFKPLVNVQCEHRKFRKMEVLNDQNLG